MRKRTDPSGLRASMIAAINELDTEIANLENRRGTLRAALSALDGEPATAAIVRRSFERHPDLAREAILGYVRDDPVGAADITGFVLSRHSELSRGAVAGALRRLADQGILARGGDPRRLTYTRARQKPPPSQRPRRR